MKNNLRQFRVRLRPYISFLFIIVLLPFAAMATVGGRGKSIQPLPAPGLAVATIGSDGNRSVPTPAAPAAPAGKNYYFSRYDADAGADELLLSNPHSARKGVDYQLSVGGQALDLSAFSVPDAACPGNNCPGGHVPPGTSIPVSFPGLAGGPVKVTSLSRDDALVNQRIIWKGTSLEELPGIKEEDLSGHYLWPWHDNNSQDRNSWFIVSNPGASPVDYTIEVGGVQAGSGTLLPGETATPVFAGLAGGPAELKASGKVLASQRAVSGNGLAFNESPGIPEAGLSSRYAWSCFDCSDGEAGAWMLLANPGDKEIFAEIRIARETVWSGEIEPKSGVVADIPGKTGGPVEVEGWTDRNRTGPANLVASQQIVWGSSFEEVPGYPQSELARSYHWPEYDQQSRGSSTWFQIANPNDHGIDCQIKIGGVVYWSGTIEGGALVTSSFPWVKGGPVEVVSTGGPVIASQRRFWNGYFNETLGTVLDVQVPSEPEWELERIGANPNSGNYVDELVLRGVDGASLYVSSNAALWPDTANGFDYHWTGNASQADMNGFWSKAQFGTVFAPEEGVIYLAGQAWSSDTPPGSTSRRSALTVWHLADNTFLNVMMNAPGMKTDNRNEIVSLLSDGDYLIAGEAGGPPDPHGDSDFPAGGGLWLIPKATIDDASSWSRIYEEPLRGSNWHHLIKTGGFYFALQTAGTSHRLMASDNLISWHEMWSEDTQHNQEARTNLLVDAAGRLIVVHERAASNYLWVSTFDGISWSHHQTGILTALPSGNEKSFDIASAFDGEGGLVIIRGRGETWNEVPAFSDIFLIDPADGSHRPLFSGIPGWPMHQKKLPLVDGDIYFSTSYPGYIYRLERH